MRENLLPEQPRLFLLETKARGLTPGRFWLLGLLVNDFRVVVGLVIAHAAAPDGTIKPLGRSVAPSGRRTA